MERNGSIRKRERNLPPSISKWPVRNIKMALLGFSDETLTSLWLTKGDENPP